MPFVPPHALSVGAADEITDETLEVGAASPAVGQVVDDVSFPHESDATILAVIRDEPVDR